jgi:hypothetical protein
MQIKINQTNTSDKQDEYQILVKVWKNDMFTNCWLRRSKICSQLENSMTYYQKCSYDTELTDKLVMTWQTKHISTKYVHECS